jgi:hypothetical protein
MLPAIALSDKATLVVIAFDRPLPVPIVKPWKWMFDGEAGVANDHRRVASGLGAIDVMYSLSTLRTLHQRRATAILQASTSSWSAMKTAQWPPGPPRGTPSPAGRLSPQRRGLPLRGGPRSHHGYYYRSVYAQGLRGRA